MNILLFLFSQKTVIDITNEYWFLVSIKLHFIIDSFTFQCFVAYFTMITYITTTVQIFLYTIESHVIYLINTLTQVNPRSCEDLISIFYPILFFCTISWLAYKLRFIFCIHDFHWSTVWVMFCYIVCLPYPHLQKYFCIY